MRRDDCMRGIVLLVHSVQDKWIQICMPVKQRYENVICHSADLKLCHSCMFHCRAARVNEKYVNSTCEVHWSALSTGSNIKHTDGRLPRLHLVQTYAGYLLLFQHLKYLMNKTQLPFRCLQTACR